MYKLLLWLQYPFESHLSRALVHFFTITIVIITITIIGSAAMYFNLIYYAFILAFAFEGTSGCNYTVTSTYSSFALLSVWNTFTY